MEDQKVCKDAQSLIKIFFFWAPLVDFSLQTWHYAAIHVCVCVHSHVQWNHIQNLYKLNIMCGRQQSVLDLQVFYTPKLCSFVFKFSFSNKGTDLSYATSYRTNVLI